VKCLVHLKYLNHMNYECGSMAFIRKRHVDYDVNRHSWLLWYWLQNISQLWINHQLQLLCERSGSKHCTETSAPTSWTTQIATHCVYLYASIIKLKNTYNIIPWIFTSTCLGYGKHFVL